MNGVVNRSEGLSEVLKIEEVETLLSECYLMIFFSGPQDSWNLTKCDACDGDATLVRCSSI